MKIIFLPLITFTLILANDSNKELQKKESYDIPRINKYIQKIQSKNKFNKNIKFSLDDFNNKVNLGLSYIPFEKNDLNVSNNIEELKILETKIRINKETVEIEKIDLLKIHHKNSNINFSNEFTWKVYLGYKNYNQKELFGTYGMGYTFYNNSLQINPMIDFSIVNTNNYYKIHPNIDLLYDLDKTKFKINYGKEFYSENKYNSIYNIETQYNIDNKNSISLYYKKESYNNIFGISLKKSF